jgi:hypothetical protein
LTYRSTRDKLPVQAKKEIGMNTMDAIEIIEGMTDATREDYIEAMQHLIDTGIVWSLQGSYGRAAAHLIESGDCVPAENYHVVADAESVGQFGIEKVVGDYLQNAVGVNYEKDNDGQIVIYTGLKMHRGALVEM